MILISVLYIFAGCLLGGAVYLLILLLSWLIDNMKTEERSCSNCYYNREGKCTTKFSEDCRKYEHFIWEPIPPAPPAVEPAHKIPKKKIEIVREGDGDMVGVK